MIEAYSDRIKSKLEERMTTDETHSLGACLKHWRLQKGLSLEVIALKTRIPLKYLHALETNDSSTLPPIEPVGHTLGEFLRQYRERQGLSIERIAERTRVPLASLHALEENNAKSLPEAPVIVRGFVDAYLNCLTLERAEKEIVLIHLGKMVETVYAQPRQAAADTLSSAREQSHHRSSTPYDAWIDRLHTRALEDYVRLTNWRTAFCRHTVSASQTSLACIDRILDRTSTLSVQASRVTFHTMTTFTVAVMERIRPDGGWSTLWSHTRDAVMKGVQQLRRAWASVRGDLAPLVQWSFLRHRLIKKEPALDYRQAMAPESAQSKENKPWVWLVQYGVTVLLLLMLGSTAATIPLFKDTAIAETKLTASNLVAFIGYGGGVLMLWLMVRKALVQLIPNRSAFSFLRPLGAPFNTLLGVSVSYKLLLTLLGPSLGKADRLTYNWIFVALILAATIWLIRTWFLKSAPLLDSLDTTDQANRSTGVAIASFRD
ncbi:MAG: helix-turn-helix domain-containing protein [Nitrospira sp.]|nr:helix-turn-helix domain-containing protein [Nitrospira sp.]